jgi:hypothetical protein
MPAIASRIPVITYKKGELAAMPMVGAFAHELARMLVETFDEPPPGGAPLHEPAIDLAAVFMGFGVFMANSMVEATRYDLNEGEFVHALAIFCQLRKIPPESVSAHLNPHLRKYLRLAARDLAQHFARALRKVRTADAAGEAEVVLNLGAATRLSANRPALDHDGFEAFGRAVDGRAQAGRAGAIDRDVVFRLRRIAKPA